MRIHLPLPASFFDASSKPKKDAPPIVQLGGELVLMELQGEIHVEGERAGGVVGVLGFERPDKPTLHIGAHHLLHGKVATLNKPYAVIRKVITNKTDNIIRPGAGKSPIQAKAPIALDSEDDEGSSDDAGEDEEAPDPMVTPARPSAQAGPSNATPRSAIPSRLMPPASSPTAALASSSPPGPPSQARDYSSDLDSSPVLGSTKGKRKWTHAPDELDELTPRPRRVKSRKSEKAKERTRAYEVVGVVRKKVVFSLRPEPIVTATILPE